MEPESLYEEVALAVAEFRDDPLFQKKPVQFTEFTVGVLRNPTDQKLRLSPVEAWPSDKTPGEVRPVWRSVTGFGGWWHPMTRGEMSVV